MKAVIFDLDGTLVDSAPDIHAAANALLNAVGYPPLPYEQVKSFIGNGIPKLVERVMRVSHIDHTPERHADLVARFTDLYSIQPATKSALYPNVDATLEYLDAQGFTLGVCTNKDRDLSIQVLKGLGIGGFFSSVIGGDSLPQRKPDAAPLLECARQLGADEFIYVGDSEVDAATAEAAKAAFVLFTEGYRKTPVEKRSHDFAISDFSDLAEFVETWFRASVSA